MCPDGVEGDTAGVLLAVWKGCPGMVGISSAEEVGGETSHAVNGQAAAAWTVGKAVCSTGSGSP